SLVEHMLEHEILADHEGRLLLGPQAEKTFGRAYFRPLYAVFDAPRLTSVMHATQGTGAVDATFFTSLGEDDDPGAFTLGGRNWQVLDIDWSRGRCVVKPAEAGKAARWSGSARHLGYEVCQAMKGILVDEAMDPEWTQRAQAVIAQLRADYYFL